MFTREKLIVLRQFQVLRKNTVHEWGNGGCAYTVQRNRTQWVLTQIKGGPGCRRN